MLALLLVELFIGKLLNAGIIWTKPLGACLLGTWRGSVIAALLDFVSALPVLARLNMGALRGGLAAALIVLAVPSAVMPMFCLACCRLAKTGGWNTVGQGAAGVVAGSAAIDFICGCGVTIG